jgi:hypothetical protein
MIQGKHRNIILGAVIIAAALIAITFIPGRKLKPTPPTAKETAQNECSVTAYKKYTIDKLAITNSNASDPLSIFSVDKILAKRRLQEQFCLEFVRCNPEKPTNDAVTSVSESVRFDSCLRDEMLEEYDAVPREDGDDADD